MFNDLPIHLIYEIMKYLTYFDTCVLKVINHRLDKLIQPQFLKHFLSINKNELGNLRNIHKFIFTQQIMVQDLDIQRFKAPNTFKKLIEINFLYLPEIVEIDLTHLCFLRNVFIVRCPKLETIRLNPSNLFLNHIDVYQNKKLNAIDIYPSFTRLKSINISGTSITQLIVPKECVHVNVINAISSSIRELYFHPILTENQSRIFSTRELKPVAFYHLCVNVFGCKNDIYFYTPVKNKEKLLFLNYYDYNHKIIEKYF